MVLGRFALASLLLLAASPALAARDVMLVLDDSGSMRRNDPTRLAAPAVAEFIRRQPPDTRVGMVLFSTEAQLAMPLTPVEVASDGEAARALAQFTYRGRWTRTAAAVERALYELRLEGRPEASRAIVLMTDGLIDTGDAARDAGLHRWLREDLAAQAAREGVGIFGIAFTERADYRLLQSLAATTGGEYFRILEAGDIARTLARIETVLAADRPTQAQKDPPAPATPMPDPARDLAAAPTQADAAGTDGVGSASVQRGVRVGLAALALLLGIGMLAWVWRSRSTSAHARGRPGDGPFGVLYDAQERHELGARPVVIGRAGGHDPTRQYVVIAEKTVGRWHATIERRGQTFWLRDEGSVNGTFINGERVIGERPLKHGDTLRIHSHEFAFEIPELADADRTLLHGAPRLNQSGA